MVGKILANDVEISYAKENSLDGSLNLEIIPFIKRITNKSRMNLGTNSRKLINELNGFLDKYPASKIVFFSQFNKGDIRSRRELEIIKRIQLESNLETFVFQEISEDEGLESLKEEIKQVIRIAKNREIFAVLDIKSKDIEDKVDFLLKNGIKNFIIRGGEYSNVRKWVEIRELIRRHDGMFVISLYGRWDEDKVSYIKHALSLGCDYTFHEKPAPYPVDVKNILNLDGDFVYRQISVDGDYGVTISDDNKYSFSRARTLLKAQELSAEIEIIEISNA